MKSWSTSNDSGGMIVITGEAGLVRITASDSQGQNKVFEIDDLEHMKSLVQCVNQARELNNRKKK